MWWPILWMVISYFSVVVVAIVTVAVRPDAAPAIAVVLEILVRPLAALGRFLARTKS